MSEHEGKKVKTVKRAHDELESIKVQELEAELRRLKQQLINAKETVGIPKIREKRLSPQT